MSTVILKEEVIEVLESARELLSTKSRWSPNHYALAKNNGEVSPHSECAIKWNISGAISKFAYQKKDHYKTVDYFMADTYLVKLVSMVKLSFILGGYHPILNVIVDQSNQNLEHELNNEIYKIESKHDYNYMMSQFNKAINPY